MRFYLSLYKNLLEGVLRIEITNTALAPVHTNWLHCGHSCRNEASVVIGIADYSFQFSICNSPIFPKCLMLFVTRYQLSSIEPMLDYYLKFKPQIQ